MTCERHGGNAGSIMCRECDLETIEREGGSMTTPTPRTMQSCAVWLDGEDGERILAVPLDTAELFLAARDAELDAMKQLLSGPDRQLVERCFELWFAMKQRAEAAERERAAKVCEQERADWFKDPRIRYAGWA